MLVALLSLAAVAVPARSFDQERLLLSRRLETLRRILPDGRHPARELAIVQQLLGHNGLIGARSTARVESPTEPRHVVVDLEGEATYGEIDRLFGQVALSHRLIDVARIELGATGGELVRFQAVLRVPFFPTGTPLPPPPLGTQELLSGVPVALAEAFRRDESLALAKSEAIAALRRARRNPRLFLAELAAVARDRPVILTHAELEDEFNVRGLAVGEGAVRALEKRFEHGFFRVREFLMAVSGACHRFEVRGTSPVVGPEAELPLPADDPFLQDEAPCRVDRDPGVARTIRAGKPRGGTGPLNVRLRSVDLADAFGVLHRLTGQGFVVDEDVRGRVSLELTNVTLEEAIRALGEAGTAVSPPGLIRRVSRPGGAEPQPHLAGEDAPGEARVRFSLKRVEVREILALMTEIDGDLAAVGPQASLGRVSVWVREAPLDLVRSAVLESARLVERFDEQRILERHSGATEALFPIVWEAPPRALVLSPEDLSVDELVLSGVASAGRDWTAFAYAATGVLQAYRPGDRLADAKTRSVASTDVVLESAGNAIRLFLGPP